MQDDSSQGSGASSVSADSCPGEELATDAAPPADKGLDAERRAMIDARERSDMEWIARWGADQDAVRTRSRRIVGASVFLLASLLSLIVCGTLVLERGKRFEEGYVQPLTKAVEATDPDIVLDHLDRAIKYAERHGLTHGNTSDPPTPRNDLAAWHRALLAVEADSGKLDEDSTLHDCRQVRKRTRTALLDPNTHELRYPRAMALYPWHHVYIDWGYFTVAGVLVAILALIRRLLLD